MKPQRDITILLQDYAKGDQAAFDELIPLVYQQLKKMCVRSVQKALQIP